MHQGITHRWPTTTCSCCGDALHPQAGHTAVPGRRARLAAKTLVGATYCIEVSRNPQSRRISEANRRGNSILQNLRALHHDIAVGLDINLAASLNRDVLAFDDDGALLFHGNARRAGSDRDGVAGVDHEIFGDFQRIVTAHLRTAITVNLQ